MNSSDPILVNPYNEKYPELSRIFSDLRTAFKPAWYEKPFLLDLSTYHEKFIRSYLAMFLIAILTSALVSQVLPPDKNQVVSASISWAICFLVIHKLISGLFVLHRHLRKRTKFKIFKIAECLLDSIQESSWRQLKYLLLDLQNTDQYMVVDASDRHKEISHHLGLVLLSEPNPFSKLNALEYLFADYADGRIARLNPYDSTNKVKETYFGYLSKLQRRKNIEKTFTTVINSDDLPA